MKKLVSLSLALLLTLALALPVMGAGGGVTLRKTADSWYIDVTNGYEGTVTFKDQKVTYTKYVSGNGEYFIGLQRDLTGELELNGDYEVGPHIVGTRTEVTTERTGYVLTYEFLAKQSGEKGPKANYVKATVTETYKITTTIYDVWSNGDETFNSSSFITDTKVFSDTTGALDNGSKTYPSVALGGLGGYVLYIAYTGNGDTQNICIVSAPDFKTVIE